MHASENTSMKNRHCRLVLVLPAVENAQELLQAALSGGDIASVILTGQGMAEADFAAHCNALVPLIKNAGVAALVANDTQIAGRSGADGILFEKPDDSFRDMLARFSPQKIVGFGGALTRHRSLELAEASPDFIFFGKTDGDIRREAHPKNLALGEWWAQMVEIPCVVMGGSTVESVVEIAACGADFAALGLGVFAHIDGPEAAVAIANELLEKHAPILDTQ
jgi:thiamine-phosphate pyrophosphorylase